MRYRVRHATVYTYSEPVVISHNVLHLAPRATANQRVHSHRVELRPMAAVLNTATDWFGNQVVHATVQEPHIRLTIEGLSEVDVQAPAFRDPALSPPWEQVVHGLAAAVPEATLREAVEFRFSSPQVPLSEDFARFALPSFTPGKPLLAAALDLVWSIHKDFTFDPTATTVETPVEQVLARRRGVCQDFAHLTLASLRSLGLAARYVSGYLETIPPPDQERLVGADASHAWVQLHDPGHGWIDLDPTNGIMVQDRHVTVAWGRDVGDVSPTKGMILGGGQNSVQVSVDVEPLPG